MNTARTYVQLWCVALAFTYGCVPAIEDDPSLALEGQILGVRFQPAEVKPEGETRATALIVSEEEDRTADVAFSMCVARKPLSELGPVHPACLSEEKGNDALQALGKGSRVKLAVPKNACNLFGPQRPVAEPGQPPGRPVDPDASGGFYQPVIARLDDAVLGSLRLNCGVPGGTQAQVAQYNQEHEDNQNPTVKKVEIRVPGGQWEVISLDDQAPLRVSRNQIIRVRSEWDELERYLYLDPESREFVKKTETLIASFYSSIGGFDEHRVQLDDKGRVTSEFESGSERGEIQVWIVVRDDRGGLGWESFKLDVR